MKYEFSRKLYRFLNKHKKKTKKKHTHTMDTKKLDALVSQFKGEKLEFMNIYQILFDLMKVSEEFQGLTGVQKKQTVLKYMKEILIDQDIDPAFLSVLSPLVDFIVDISKNKKKLQKFKKNYMFCCN